MPNELAPYAFGPIRAFSRYCRDSERLMSLGMQGISMIANMPDLMEAILDLDENMTADEKRSALEKAKEQAEFAQRECKSGFPLLHAHTLVGVWGALEATIEDLVVGVLANEPDALRNDAFAKIRITLAEYERLDLEERMRFLVSELQRQPGFAGCQGVDRIEKILETVDLSGRVDAEIKASVWEAHNLRNVIVHRGALADRRLVANCPSLGLKVGDLVVVTSEALAQYFIALVKYATTIKGRMKEKYHVDDPPPA